MYEIHKTAVFTKWESRLAKTTRLRIATRIERLEHGLPGDTKVVSRGIWELRIHFGPGYRIYFMKRDKTLILLLCGGDKTSQSKDIAAAQKIAESYFD